MSSEWRLVFGCAVAVAVPALMLHLPVGEDRTAAGLTAAPFAWPWVLVWHLATALPLGLVLAGWLRTTPSVNKAARGLWAVVGFAAAGLMAVASPRLGEVVAGGDAWVLLLVRAALATGLVLPWCVLATGPPPKAAPPGRPGLLLAFCAGLALVPSGLYADAICEERTKAAGEAVATGRLARADRALAGLAELGSERPVAGKSPTDLRRQVRKEIDQLERGARSPLPANAPAEARLARALALIQLDRLPQAADLLSPLATDNTQALLLLAVVDRDRGRWGESDARYEAALARLLPRVAADQGAAGLCRLCFEGLAFNARNDRRPADAEHALRRGLQALPAEAAFFRFQLGKHHADGGRPWLAAEHLRVAVELAPAAYREQADKIRTEARRSTPACLHW